MRGSIYSDQRCPICGSNFKDNRKDALQCPEHPNIKASKFRVHFNGIWKRFNSYQDAEYFLNGVRYKSSEGSFDRRDYLKDNPLGFENLATKYLEKKKHKVKCYRNIHNHISRAINYFGFQNIKEIGYGQIEDFIDTQRKIDGNPLSGKTIHNISASLQAFWQWACKREKISIPIFPETPFQLGWRNTVSLEVQDEIIEEVRKICTNPKIWLGIYLLSIYPKIRPVELIHIKEKDMDLNLGIIIVTHNKEGKDNKIVRLTKEDAELIKSVPRGFPNLYFFRHDKGYLVGKRFGKDLLYSNWKRACKNLGVEGVDLYGGTKHSTVKSMREYFSPSEIKQGTGIASNKAFERYFQHENQDELKICQKRNELRRQSKGGNVLAMNYETSQIDK